MPEHRVPSMCRPGAAVWLAVCAGLWSAGGCARDQYRFGLGPKVPRNTSLVPNPITIGGDHPRLDRVERIVQVPIQAVSRWFRDPGAAEMHPEIAREHTVRAAQEFLVLNELQDVHLNIRDYDPGQQWQRLADNDRIHPFWKYTTGSLHVLGYSILPGRVFHYDRFDAFTNTLHINSTEPTSVLYEAARAKELRQHRLLGTYGTLQHAPLVPLWHNTQVTSDVLTYARTLGRPELERRMYPTAYAGLGAAAVSEAVSLVPFGAGAPIYTAPLVIMAGGAAGAVTGHAVATTVE